MCMFFRLLWNLHEFQIRYQVSSGLISMLRIFYGISFKRFWVHIVTSVPSAYWAYLIPEHFIWKIHLNSKMLECMFHFLYMLLFRCVQNYSPKLFIYFEQCKNNDPLDLIELLKYPGITWPLSWKCSYDRRNE